MIRIISVSNLSGLISNLFLSNEQITYILYSNSPTCSLRPSLVRC